jgi:hypothetical protein
MAFVQNNVRTLLSRASFFLRRYFTSQCRFCGSHPVRQFARKPVLSQLSECKSVTVEETGVDLQSFIRLLTQSQTDPLANGHLKLTLLPQQRGATSRAGAGVYINLDCGKFQSNLKYVSQHERTNLVKNYTRQLAERARKQGHSYIDINNHLIDY